MNAQTLSTPPKSARERLLAAAGELFAEASINTVGIDRIIEHAGVAKASLYGVFGSKEELVRAYLQERQQKREAHFTQALARIANPRDRLLGVFDVMDGLMSDPKFRGCALVRARAELKADCSVKSVWESSRTWAHKLFSDLAREAGAKDPVKLGNELVILYDGASITATMDGDANAAKKARAMAQVLLDAATR